MGLNPDFTKKELEESEKKTSSELPKVKMRVSKEKCLNCGGCVATCPYNAIKFMDPGIYFTEKCKNCRICEKACPVGAIYNTESDDVSKIKTKETNDAEDKSLKNKILKKLEVLK